MSDEELNDTELAATAGVKPRVKDGSKRINITAKAVIIYDDQGNYLIHGSNDGTPEDFFKKMQPLWDLNPAIETARYVTFQLSLPEIALLPKVRIYPE